MSAIAVMSAAALAYRKAVKKTHTSNGKDILLWLKEFRNCMPELSILESKAKASSSLSVNIIHHACRFMGTFVKK
jgi:hypothetical protein